MHSRGCLGESPGLSKIPSRTVPVKNKANTLLWRQLRVQSPSHRSVHCLIYTECSQGSPGSSRELMNKSMGCVYRHSLIPSYATAVTTISFLYQNHNWNSIDFTTDVLSILHFIWINAFVLEHSVSPYFTWKMGASVFHGGLTQNVLIVVVDLFSWSSLCYSISWHWSPLFFVTLFLSLSPFLYPDLLPTCHICHFMIISCASYSVFLSVKTVPLRNVLKIHSSSCHLLQGFGVPVLRYPLIVPQLFCPLVLLLPLWNSSFPPASCVADANSSRRIWLCCCVTRLQLGFNTEHWKCGGSSFPQALPKRSEQSSAWSSMGALKPPASEATLAFLIFLLVYNKKDMQAKRNWNNDI